MSCSKLKTNKAIFIMAYLSLNMHNKYSRGTPKYSIRNLKRFSRTPYGNSFLLLNVDKEGNDVYK